LQLVLVCIPHVFRILKEVASTLILQTFFETVIKVGPTGMIQTPYLCFPCIWLALNFFYRNTNLLFRTSWHYRHTSKSTVTS